MNWTKYRSGLKNTFVVFVLLCTCLQSQAKTSKVLAKQFAFPLWQVRLTKSPFYNAMMLDKQWLLSFDPDRFLSGFRSESGLLPKAPKYGGWESQGVAGQTFGHYLSALALMYASTDDEKLCEKIKYSVNELAMCQQAFELNGLVAAFPRAKALFSEIQRGDIRTEGFDLNGGWVPLYSMHKLFAGLIDVYKYTGNKQAYKVLSNLAKGLDVMLSNLSDQQVQKILICEHGGINESLAEVYALTGNEKYLKLALRLNHQLLLSPLVRKKDELAGKHANTQIPKVIGFIREYELNQADSLYKAANFFWNTVVHNHSYVIGGNSESEHFGLPGHIYDRISDKTCENCNTYNMLKLTKHLYMLDPSVAKLDFYERALYNQILASQNPLDGMVCYMSPLAAGSHRAYSTPFDSFWCCVGTGLENHARYGEFIYSTDATNGLYVNLFIPSILTWSKKKIEIHQETSFPESDSIILKVKTKKPREFTLHLRYPSWAKNGFEVRVNGLKYNLKGVPGSFISITRTWSDKDMVSFRLPMGFSSEAALGDEHLRAFLFGPIVLSADFEGKTPESYPVAVVDDFNKADSVVVPTDRPLEFRWRTAQPYAVKMKPYYKMQDGKIMVYFEHYSHADWNSQKDAILLRQNHGKWVQEKTVSHFRPGEMQPERDHHLSGERMELGELNGRKFRKAIDGGWFSFEMDVLPDVRQDLVATFWGNLGDVYKFNIEVDNQLISNVIIHWWGSDFIDKTYTIPFALTKGKQKVNVTFKAMDDRSVAGPLFDCKILKN